MTTNPQNTPQSGLFIVFEGGEGSGKTTNLAYFIDRLQAKGIDLIATREPGGTAMAEEIREVLLSPRDEKVSPDAELLLMFAARAQHLAAKIKPALADGQWVICDRFTDATYAYQGGGRELGFDKIAQLETLVQGDLRPDLTVLLDVPLEVGMARAAQRGELDRMEQESQAFFERVRSTYLTRAEQSPERYRIIDASGDLDSVQRQIDMLVEDLASKYAAGDA